MKLTFINFLQILGISCFALISAAATAQDVTWNGAGDGLSWEDANNWDTGLVPTDQDFVLIPANSTVFITTAEAVRQLLMTDDAALTITPVGQLTFPTNISGDFFKLEDYASFINSGELLFTGTTGGNAIHAAGSASILNAGNTTISQSDSDAIFLENYASLVNNTNASLSVMSAGTDGIDMNDYTTVTNQGDMAFEDTEDEGINMDDDSKFYNHASLYFNLIDGNDGVDMDDQGTLFENYGMVQITNVINGGEGLEVDDGQFTNQASGLIALTNVTGEGIRIESGGVLDNYGYINIEVNPDNSDEIDGVELECSALFSNTGILDIIINGANNAAIRLECSSSRLINEDCGEINILSNNRIEIENGIFTNNGFLFTEFNGTNVNFGTFRNNGQITSQNGFQIAPNSVIEGPAVPFPFFTETIGDDGFLGNDFDFVHCNQEFVITGGGNNAISTTTDNVAFVGQSLCGDVTITAKVESVGPNGYGGLMIRESLNSVGGFPDTSSAPLDAGARQVAIFSNLTNALRLESRFMPNTSKQVQSFQRINPQWLRLQRQGDFVFTYSSSNGISFQIVQAVYVPMNSCVEVGMASFTFNPNQQTTAIFSNVTVSGLAVPNVEAPAAPELAEAPIKTALNLYPNPATEAVHLEFGTALNKHTTVTLRNTMGQVIEQRELHEGALTSTWNISDLANGVYFFEIPQGPQRTSKVKFVKTR